MFPELTERKISVRLDQGQTRKWSWGQDMWSIVVKRAGYFGQKAQILLLEPSVNPSLAEVSLLSKLDFLYCKLRIVTVLIGLAMVTVCQCYHQKGNLWLYEDAWESTYSLQKLLE